MNDFKEYSELYHHGIKGMRWGVRRYQNPDGSLTPEGRRKYLNPDGTLNRKGQKLLKKQFGVKSDAKILGLGIAGALYGQNDVRYYRGRVKHYQYMVDGYAERGNMYQSNWVRNHGLKKSRMKRFGGYLIAGAAVALTAFALYRNSKKKKLMEQRGKQYVDFLKSGKLNTEKQDSAVTKKVKSDFNVLSDEKFKSKYGVSKKTYKDRVMKYGDPYMNSPLAKAGKKLQKSGFFKRG